VHFSVFTLDGLSGLTIVSVTLILGLVYLLLSLAQLASSDTCDVERGSGGGGTWTRTRGGSGVDGEPAPRHSSGALSAQAHSQGKPLRPFPCAILAKTDLDTWTTHLTWTSRAGHETEGLAVPLFTSCSVCKDSKFRAGQRHYEKFLVNRTYSNCPQQKRVQRKKKSNASEKATSAYIQCQRLDLSPL